MNYTIEVTQEEYDAIMKLRIKKQNERQARAIDLLNSAHSYLWCLRTTGLGDTYSTFCEDFGYKAKDGEDRAATYKNVVSIIRHTHELTTQA